MTHRLTIGLRIYWKIIVPKHMLHDRRGWLAQPIMPPIKRHLDRTKNLSACEELERIETSLNPVVV
jgi:hypothetical protein